VVKEDQIGIRNVFNLKKTFPSNQYLRFVGLKDAERPRRPEIRKTIPHQIPVAIPLDPEASKTICGKNRLM
jgi:hypothetical protein